MTTQITRIYHCDGCDSMQRDVEPYAVEIDGRQTYAEYCPGCVETALLEYLVLPIDGAGTRGYLDPQVSAAVDDWWRLASAGYTSLYLAYRPTDPATGRGGRIRVVHEAEAVFSKPEFHGFEIADPNRMPLNRERSHIAAWLTERVWRLPILPIPAGA